MAWTVIVMADKVGKAFSNITDIRSTKTKNIYIAKLNLKFNAKEKQKKNSVD